MESKNWTKDWFEANFHDIRKHKAKKGQVLAQFRASAFFVDDWVKRNVIQLLKTNSAGAESSMKVLRNLVCAIEFHSITVPLEMALDLNSGMTDDQVADKEYKMVVEYNYWTEKQNIPIDDPHWSYIKMLNTDDMDDRVKFSYVLPE